MKYLLEIFTQTRARLTQAFKGRQGLYTAAWLLFLVCGIIYLAAGIRDGDPLMIAGSLCFLVAVVIFLLPGGNR